MCAALIYVAEGSGSLTLRPAHRSERDISKQLTQMGFVQDDHVVQQFPAPAPHPALRHAVLPGTAISGSDQLTAKVFQHRRQLSLELRQLQRGSRMTGQAVSVTHSVLRQIENLDTTRSTNPFNNLPRFPHPTTWSRLRGHLAEVLGAHSRSC